MSSLYTLIGADQSWALCTALLAAAAFHLWPERTRWGARLSGTVITLMAAFLLSNLGIIPAVSPVYDRVWTSLVPLAIPLLLLQVNLVRILRESGATLIAFSATYTGGSINYLGAVETVGLRSGDLLTAGIAADNLNCRHAWRVPMKSAFCSCRCFSPPSAPVPILPWC